MLHAWIVHEVHETSFIMSQGVPLCECSCIFGSWATELWFRAKQKKNFPEIFNLMFLLSVLFLNRLQFRLTYWTLWCTWQTIEWDGNVFFVVVVVFCLKTLKKRLFLFVFFGLGNVCSPHTQSHTYTRGSS